MHPAVHYCSVCGSPVQQLVPPGDTKLRHVCPSCQTIHYQNPRIVAGTLPVWQDKVLLCRRAIEPRHGYWTLPAGFMENGESLEQAAERETAEEAGCRIQLENLFAVVSIPHIHQVHFFYRAELLSPDCHPGEETLEAALFPEADIPWPDLAFHSVRYALERFFAERRQGARLLHSTTLNPTAPD
ncbi:NUDIX hydrolase [Denitratisoma sp. agr-D3]